MEEKPSLASLQRPYSRQKAVPCLACIRQLTDAPAKESLEIQTLGNLPCPPQMRLELYGYKFLDLQRLDDGFKRSSDASNLGVPPYKKGHWLVCALGQYQ
jgi:hypothetical protein